MTETKVHYYEWQIIGGDRMKVEVDYPTTIFKEYRVRQFSKEHPPPHGHHLRYFSYGCRGPKCTAAATAYRRDQRIERRKHIDLDDPNFPHGTPYGYSHLGCRRECCKAAMREHQSHYTESPAAKARRAERGKQRRAAKKLEATPKTKVAA